MKKLSYIIDAVITLGALTVLGAVTAGYFLKDRVMIFTFATVFALTATYFTGITSDRVRKKSQKSKDIEASMNKFVFSPESYAYDFTLAAISKRCEPVERSGFILTPAAAFKPHFTPDKVSASELSKLYALALETGAKRVVVLSSFGVGSDAEKYLPMLSNPNVEIWDFNKVYDFFSRLGCTPTEKLEVKKEKKSLRGFAARALKKENARRYLFTAVVTLIFARFLPHPALYVFVSSLTLVLALLCRMRVAERLTA